MRHWLCSALVVGLAIASLLTVGVSSAVAGEGPSGEGKLYARAPDGGVASDPVPARGLQEIEGLEELYKQVGWPDPNGALNFVVFSTEGSQHTADNFNFVIPRGIVAATFDTATTGFPGDPENPGVNFFIRIWDDDPKNPGQPGPTGEPIFISGPHNLDDGILTAVQSDAEQANTAAVKR